MPTPKLIHKLRVYLQLIRLTPVGPITLNQMMNVRNMKVEDALAVATINTLAWQFAYKGIIDQKFLDSMDVQRRENSWRLGIETNDPALIRLVAESNGIVAGYAIGLENRKTAEMPHCDSELWAIYVHPEVLQRGAGKALLHQFKSELRARGKTRMCVWALKENHLARKFYEGQGGILVGVRNVTIGEQTLPEVGYEFAL